MMLTSQSLLPAIRSVAEYGRVYCGCYFFLCPITDISATPIGVKFCTMDDGTYRSRTGFLLFGGDAPGDRQNPKILA